MKNIELSFELVEGIMLVEGIADKTGGYYIFDTGCEQTTINSIYCKVNNEKTETVAVYEGELKEISIVSGEVTELCIGELHLKNQNVLSMDLTETENELTGKEQKYCLLGTVGIDIISAYCVTIDYRKKIITLSTDRSSNMDNIIKFTTINNLIIIDAQVECISGKFIFDSGANVCMLSSSKFKCDSWSLADSEQSVYSVPSIYIKNEKYCDVLSIYSKIDALEEMGVDGIIGVFALGIKKLFIDFKNNELMIEK